MDSYDATNSHEKRDNSWLPAPPRISSFLDFYRPHEFAYNENEIHFHLAF
jgi:hypothetical protein